MAKRLRLMPYKLSSGSAKALAEGLKELDVNVLRVKLDGKYIPREEDVIINWGSSKNPVFDIRGGCKLLNPPERVHDATNKVMCFRALEAANVPTLDFTLDPDVAYKWLEEPGVAVFARSLLAGHGGAGIIVLHNQVEYQDTTYNQRQNFKFFTKHQASDSEFRVHVVNGKMIDAAQKKQMGNDKLKAEGIELDMEVRNHNKGWIFARQGVVIPDSVRDACIAAVAAVKLDFGAVDVLYSNLDGPFILEINTAPGLEGTTLTRYIAAMKGAYDEA